MKKDDMKAQYDEIASLYDMAEDLAATVESKSIKNPKQQMAIVEPLINDISDSADVLTEEYINIMENPSRKKSAKNRIEKALRKIFMALDNYRAHVNEISGNTLAALSNIADGIVNKIHKQAEKIMIVFMRLLDISLERIMRAHELAEFRRNNEKFTNTLPQHSH